MVLVAARTHPTFRPIYLRFREAGKPAKVALTALMRKILIYLNGLMKTPDLSPA